MCSVVIGRVAASVAVGLDGKTHAGLEVTAESVRFLGDKNGANGATQGETEMDTEGKTFRSRL